MALAWAYVLYAEEGAPLWHQRLCLGRVALSSSDVVSLTPDGDLYCEDYGDGNADVKAVLYGPFGASPLGVPANAVCRFALEPTPAEKEQVRAEAKLIAAEECRGRAAAVGNLQLLANRVFLLPMVAAAAITTDAAPAAPEGGILRGVLPPKAMEDIEGAWRAAMSYRHVRYGVEVTGHARTASCIGDRDHHDLGNGECIFVEFVAPALSVAFFDRALDSDARVMPIRRNKQGRREITWREMRETIRQEDFGSDWDLPGPRTSLWCIEYIDHEGLGIEGHHERFRTVCKLQATDWGVMEHFQLAVQIKYALLVDQLDGTNLVSVESKFRRMQTIEYAHGDVARVADAKAIGGRMSLEEQTVFLGASRAHSAVMVCPSLLVYVREEFEKEAKLSKALRSARGEREGKRKGGKK